MNNNQPITNHMGLPNEPGYNNPPDLTPRREGGDDSLAEARPDDPANDQKVLHRSESERTPAPGDATPGSGSPDLRGEDSSSSR